MICFHVVLSGTTMLWLKKPSPFLLFSWESESANLFCRIRQRFYLLTSMCKAVTVAGYQLDFSIKSQVIEPTFPMLVSFKLHYINKSDISKFSILSVFAWYLQIHADLTNIEKKEFQTLPQENILFATSGALTFALHNIFILEEHSLNLGII